jgi:hypothetical protein
VNTVMNLRVPYIILKFLTSCTIGGFSRRAQLHEVSYVFSLLRETPVSYTYKIIGRITVLRIVDSRREDKRL